MLELQYFLLSWGRRPPFYRCIISQVSRSTPPLYRKPRSTKQTLHQKQMSKTTVYKNKPFTKKRKRLQYKPSPKSILQENGLQNKPFTKKHSPWKRSTKQAFHQRTFSKKMVYKTNCSPKKRVYKTNLSPKKNLQEIGLQNKLFTKKTSPKKRSTKQTFHQKKLKKTVYKKGIGHKCSPRKRSTQGPWPQTCGRSNHISDM